MAEITSHKGVVVDSLPGRLIVRVTDECKCDGCAIVSFCGSNKSEDLLTLPTPDAGDFAKGDLITFEPSAQSQWAGIFITFVIPVLLSLATALVLLSLQFAEWAAVLGAIGILIVYFAMFVPFVRSGKLKPVKWMIKKV